jgi:hypothetical protein
MYKVLMTEPELNFFRAMWGNTYGGGVASDVYGALCEAIKRYDSLPLKTEPTAVITNTFKTPIEIDEYGWNANIDDKKIPTKP